MPAGQGQPATPMFRASRLPDGRWQLTSSEATVLVTIRGDTALVQGPGGIVLRPPFLLDAAWETAQATQAAVHMPAEVVAAMAAARQLQRAVEATASRIGDRLYGAPGGTDMISAVGDLASLEASLLEAYDRLLALLHPPPPAGASDAAAEQPVP